MGYLSMNWSEDFQRLPKEYRQLLLPSYQPELDGKTHTYGYKTQRDGGGTERKYLSTVPEGAVQATCRERRAIASLFWL